MLVWAAAELDEDVISIGLNTALASVLQTPPELAIVGTASVEAIQISFVWYYGLPPALTYDCCHTEQNCEHFSQLFSRPEVAKLQFCVYVDYFSGFTAKHVHQTQLLLLMGSQTYRIVFHVDSSPATALRSSGCALDHVTLRPAGNLRRNEMHALQLPGMVWYSRV